MVLRLTARAIGWTIILLWIVTLTLPVSVVFSLMRLAEGNNLGFQEPTFTFSNGNISISMAIYVNNTGFYDVSEANVMIQLSKAGKTIATMSESLPNIPAGQKVNASLRFNASLNEVFQKDRTLLMDDADLDGCAVLHFKVAYAIAFNIANNFSTNWGAPFHNLTCKPLGYNDSAHTFSFFVSFSNHAFFPISGPLIVELYNSENAKIGETLLDLDVPSGEVFEKTVDVVVVDPSPITDKVFIRLFFAELNILEREWNLP